MNETATDINAFYRRAFIVGFNRFLQLKKTLSDEELRPYKDALKRLGLLVEIWCSIESKQKEKKHGTY